MGLRVSELRNMLWVMPRDARVAERLEMEVRDAEEGSVFDLDLRTSLNEKNVEQLREGMDMGFVLFLHRPGQKTLIFEGRDIKSYFITTKPQFLDICFISYLKQDKMFYQKSILYTRNNESKSKLSICLYIVTHI